MEGSEGVCATPLRTASALLRDLNSQGEKSRKRTRMRSSDREGSEACVSGCGNGVVTRLSSEEDGIENGGLYKEVESAFKKKKDCIEATVLVEGDRNEEAENLILERSPLGSRSKKNLRELQVANNSQSNSGGTFALLPSEILQHIMTFCEPADLARLESTCTLFHTSGMPKLAALEILRALAREEEQEVMEPMERESLITLAEFVRRRRAAASLSSKIGLGAYHSAMLLRSSEELDDGTSGIKKIKQTRSQSVRGAEGGGDDGDGEIVLHTCGRGFHGQLGHGDYENISEPTGVFAYEVSGASLNNGGDCDRKAGRETSIAITCGGSHTVAITKSGKLLTWGLASSGELGHTGWTPIEMAVPRLVSNLSGVRIVSIAAGANHTLAVGDCGGLWSCGRGRHGQLGHGSYSDAGPLQRVAALEKRVVVRAACGNNHSAVVTKDGGVYTWGSQVNGQLGHGTASNRGSVWPRRVEALRCEPIVAVAGGGYHTLFLSDEGVVYSAGRGRHGALGLGDSLDRHTPIEVDVYPSWLHGNIGDDDEDISPPPRVTSIAAGANHSLLLTASGDVLTCGMCNHGQLGMGDTVSRTLFTSVSSLRHIGTGVSVRAVAAGDEHSAAVDSEGGVHVWGRGDWGQLGTGYSRSQWLPVRLEKGIVIPN